VTLVGDKPTPLAPTGGHIAGGIDTSKPATDKRLAHPRRSCFTFKFGFDDDFDALYARAREGENLARAAGAATTLRCQPR
jgi:hypothetical protein